MAVLRFPMAALAPMLAHTLASPSQRIPADEPCLLLVKDAGVYLMSNGIPRLLEDGTTQQSPEQTTPSLAVYAVGLDPRVDGDLEADEAARALMGGDDFGEPIPAAWFQRAKQAGLTEVTLLVFAEIIEMRIPLTRAELVARRMAPRLPPAWSTEVRMKPIPDPKPPPVVRQHPPTPWRTPRVRPWD